LIGYMALQTEGPAVIGAIIAALIVCLVFYGLQRRSISGIKKSLQPLSAIDPNIQYRVSQMDEQMKAAMEARERQAALTERMSRIDGELKSTCADLVNLKTNIPHTNEIAEVQHRLQSLCAEFTDLKSGIQSNMDQVAQGQDQFRLSTTTSIDAMRSDMETRVRKDIEDAAHRILGEKSVPRDEFDSLVDRVSKIDAAGEVAERMDVLTSLFDSKQIKTINWQCKLIKLLKGGLAPDAEEDLIVSEGIPKTMCSDFLKNLVSSGIAERRRVPAFYMLDEYEWLYSYVDNPDQLRSRLEGTIKKEKEYQHYIRDNLGLVEDGLMLESSEYRTEGGRLDLVCVDGSGRPVVLELKYPAAPAGVVGQMAAYRSEHEKRTGQKGRFIVVSPKIPDKIKERLRDEGLHHREVPFG